MPIKKIKDASSTAVKFVTRGTYQREIVNNGALTFADGTEYEIPAIAQNVLAGTANQDELYSWIRGIVYVYDTTGTMMYEWMLLKLGTADADPDLNDSPTVELLHKEKKIFGRGITMVCDPDAGAPVKPIKFELYQVHLPYGKELRLLIRPITVTGAATGYCKGLLEWRKVSQ